MRRATLLLLALTLFGCKQIIGATDPSECAFDGDCPGDEICARARGRCVPNLRGVTADVGPRPDARVPEPDAAGVNDAGSVIDANLAIDADLPDAAPPDAALEGPVFGDEGELCFGDRSSGRLGPEGDSMALVPQGWCTPYAVAWTEIAESGDGMLRYRRGPADAPPRDGPTFQPGAPVVFDEATALLVRRNEDDFDNVFRFRVDRPDDEANRFLEERSTRQRQPARAHGVSAYVEQVNAEEEPAEEERVVLHFDDDTQLGCDRVGRRQWGVAVERDRAAWFERPVAGGATQLVVTRGLRCDQRYALRLDQTVEADAQLQLLDDHLFWIATGRGAAGRQVFTADALDLATGVRPAREDARSPIELVVGAGAFAVVWFSPQGPTLGIYRPDDPGSASVGAGGSTLRPSLSPHFALWSEQDSDGTWEINYERRAR